MAALPGTLLKLTSAVEAGDCVALRAVLEQITAEAETDTEGPRLSAEAGLTPRGSTALMM